MLQHYHPECCNTITHTPEHYNTTHFGILRHYHCAPLPLRNAATLLLLHTLRITSTLSTLQSLILRNVATIHTLEYCTTIQLQHYGSEYCDTNTHTLQQYALWNTATLSRRNTIAQNTATQSRTLENIATLHTLEYCNTVTLQHHHSEHCNISTPHTSKYINTINTTTVSLGILQHYHAATLTRCNTITRNTATLALHTLGNTATLSTPQQYHSEYCNTIMLQH